MSHVQVSVTVQSRDDPNQTSTVKLTVRDDINSMPNGMKRDATWAITMKRMGEAFIRAYHAACPPQE